MATLAEILRQTGYSQDGTLVAPAPIEPTMTSILQKHIASIPQKFNENQAAQMDLLARAYPGNTFKSMMTEGDNKALAELAMQVPFNALTAFHGTPHKIVGKFDINKVGTGEGAQAYGHGMYFAENPAVATQYKNILSKPEFTKTGEGIELRGQLPRMLNESYDELVAKNGIQQTNYGDVTDIVGQRLDRQMKDALKANDMDWYNKTADMKLDLARFRENPPPNVGNLYKVDIPDKDIPNMLNWDIPLNQQPTVLQSIKNLGARQDLPKGFDQAINRALENKHFDGQDLYYELTKVYKDPEMLRKAMQESGFTGIRYLDQGSRGTGKGSSNFVVFDPAKVDILEENAKPLTRKELIEQQLNKVVE